MCFQSRKEQAMAVVEESEPVTTSGKPYVTLVNPVSKLLEVFSVQSSWLHSNWHAGTRRLCSLSRFSVLR